jgi:hypothetical protein
MSKNVNEVRQEQPKYKTHRRIKFQRVRCEEVPAQPAYGPSQDQKEETHRADVRRDPDREAVESRKVFAHLYVDVAHRSATHPEFMKRHRLYPGGILHRHLSASTSQVMGHRPHEKRTETDDGYPDPNVNRLVDRVSLLAIHMTPHEASTQHEPDTPVRLDECSSHSTRRASLNDLSYQPAIGTSRAIHHRSSLLSESSSVFGRGSLS